MSTFNLYTLPTAAATSPDDLFLTEQNQIDYQITAVELFNSAYARGMLTNYLYYYGYVGDGASHPISGVTQWAGLDTTNWTLTQWQAHVSQVTALTNEIDGVAIQSLISSFTNADTVDIPPGRCLLSFPIQSGLYPICIKGQGQTTTYLRQVASDDGFHHGTSDVPSTWQNVAGSTFEISDLTLSCVGTPAFAIKISMSSTVGCRFRNLSIVGDGSQTTNYWRAGVSLYNCQGVIFDNVGIQGINEGLLSNTTTGISMTGNKASLFLLRDTIVNNYTAALSASSGQNGDLEGWTLDNFQCDACMDGIVITSATQPPVSSNIASPQWFITNGQFAVYRSWLHMEAVNEVFVVNNLIYLLAPNSTTSGIDFTPLDIVSLNKVGNMVFENNSFELGSGNTANNVVAISYCTGLVIEKNYIWDYGNTITAGFFNVTGNADILEKDNFFLSWRSIPKWSGAVNGVTVRSATGLSAFGGTLQLDGSVTVIGTYTTTTDAMGLATIPFSSVIYATAPTVVAVNGDFGANANASGLIASSVTTSQFKYKFSNSPNAAVRVNYVLNGR